MTNSTARTLRGAGLEVDVGRDDLKHYLEQGQPGDDPLLDRVPTVWTATGPLARRATRGDRRWLAG